jgi:hypothetical protein
VTKLSNLPFVLIAILYGLSAGAFGIAYAGLYSDYASLRDGEHVTGTVTHVEPHRTYDAVQIAYGNRHLTAYPRTGEGAALPVGAQVELLASTTGVIRASQLESKCPSLGFLVAAVLGLLGTIAAIVAHRRLRFRGAPQRQPLDIVVEGIARTRNVRLAGVFLFVPIAIGFAIVPLLDPETTLAEGLGMAGLAALSLGIAAWLGAIAYRLRDPRKNPIVELIEHHPADIAWTYIREQRSRGITVLTAMIWKADRRHESIRVVRDDADTLLAELARRAPHAARGYTRELQNQYRADPARWRPAGF